MIARLQRLRSGQRPRSRGQALAEFAIILPVLTLTILLGLDFGRVFFGWVGLQNAARHLANAASLNAAAWASPGDANAQAYYQGLILADAGSLNCTPLPVSPSPLPTPAFPDGYDLGDPAVVKLTCAFAPLTPLVSALFPGGVVVIGADAVFPIRGSLGGIAVPTPQPIVVTINVNSCVTGCNVPMVEAGGIVTITASIASPSASNIYIYLGYGGSASYTGSCSGDFTRYPSGSSIVIPAGTTVKTVTLTGCSDALVEGDETIQIAVTAVTNGSATGSWTVTIVDGATPTPTPTPVVTPTPTPTPIPTPPQCIVPQLYGRSYTYATANGVWQGVPYSFTTTLGSSPAQPWTGGSAASKTVGGQSLPPGLQYPCSTGMTVCRVNTSYALCPYHQ